MSVAALITWIITALGGAVLPGTWLGRGGLRARDTGASRFPPGLILGHFLLAATGLVIWIIYLITDADALTWVALAILVVVAALGFTMVGRWRQDRVAVAAGGTSAAPGTDVGRPPEQHFLVAVVYLHGLLAVAILILVLLTALGVGS
jgi:manganese efflux pump family protein